MTDGMEALLRALVEVGDQDIYTDSIEYRGRVMAMGRLIALVRRGLAGETVTERKVKDAARDDMRR